MEVDLFLKSVTPILKSHGFKKTRNTWRKKQVESIAVLNVQKSAWGDGAYYINLGVYFSELGNDVEPTEYSCHVRVRLEVKEPEMVVSEAMEWFDARETLNAASQLAESDSKKGLVVRELRAK